MRPRWRYTHRTAAANPSTSPSATIPTRRRLRSINVILLGELDSPTGRWGHSHPIPATMTIAADVELGRARVRYLITGGAGFIGSHLADRLVARDDSVVLMDDLSTGSLANVKHLLGDDPHASALVRFVDGSVLDYALVSSVIDEVDVVVHLAATVGVELVVRRPLETLL